MKPTDLEALQQLGVINTVALDSISAAFAQQVNGFLGMVVREKCANLCTLSPLQIFVDGLFNADPHPGNILIDRRTLRPVLLDFGLTKEV